LISIDKKDNMKLMFLEEILSVFIFEKKDQPNNLRFHFKRNLNHVFIFAFLILGTNYYLIADISEAKPPIPEVDQSVNSAIDLYISQLHSPNLSQQIAAAAALNTLGSKAAKAIPELILALKDSNDKLRFAAMHALLAIAPKHPDVVKAIIGLLDDPNPDMRFIIATNSLDPTDPQSQAIIPGLIAHLEDPISDVRYGAAFGLNHFGKAAELAIPILLKQLKSPDPSYRDSAIAGLGYIAANTRKYSSKIVLYLIDLLQDSNADIRSKSAYTIGQSFSESAVVAIPNLVLSLKDRNLEVRSMAAYSLRNLPVKDLKLLPGIIEAIDQDHGGNNNMVGDLALLLANNFGARSKAALPSLIKALKSKSSFTRLCVTYAIGKMGKEAISAVPQLIELLGDREETMFTGAGSPWIEANALNALINILPFDNRYIEPKIRKLLLAKAWELRRCRLYFSETDRPEQLAKVDRLFQLAGISINEK
jgi:HEAT repeat protein